MECLRQTIYGDRLSEVLELPRSFRDMVVDVIVLPTQNNISESPSNKKGSAFGCLKKYANPSLIAQEKHAWGQAVAERYANS